MRHERQISAESRKAKAGEVARRAGQASKITKAGEETDLRREARRYRDEWRANRYSRLKWN